MNSDAAAIMHTKPCRDAALLRGSSTLGLSDTHTWFVRDPGTKACRRKSQNHETICTTRDQLFCRMGGRKDWNDRLAVTDLSSSHAGLNVSAAVAVVPI